MNGMSIDRFGRIAMLAAAAVIGGPHIVHAHVGVGPVHDLSHAFENPLAGIALICALISVGIWATRRRRLACARRA
jgi:hydrogenase/urease accessory protein HupE